MKIISRQLKGLTLVEVLVVLGIIVGLSAIALTVINPNLQRNRARDGVLQNAVSSIGQAVDSFYGINGYYPNSSQADQLQKYLQPGFVVDKTKTPVFISNAAIPTGISATDAPAIAGTIHYFAIDATYGLPCLEAYSNAKSTQYISWAPGYAVKTLNNSCRTKAGYAELTGIVIP